MIQKEFYYVDKTPIIGELLDDKAKVILFTRPRRFGKTLNMSMLKYFFEDDRELKNDGYKYVSCYRIAFCGKECAVHCQPCAITK